MEGNVLGTRAARIGLAGTIGLGAYLLAIRPRQLQWGATDEEVKQPLPGDEVVEHPTFNATRAVTVGARPEDIWPWLVQIGFHRAGWYSYDWDNLFRSSAESIIPDLQHIGIGASSPWGPATLPASGSRTSSQTVGCCGGTGRGT